MAGAGKDPTGAAPGTVYFELTPIGASVKVVAIDAVTGTEVSIVRLPMRPKPTSGGSPCRSSKPVSKPTPEP